MRVGYQKHDFESTHPKKSGFSTLLCFQVDSLKLKIFKKAPDIWKMRSKNGQDRHESNHASNE
jgi:hypothetical protein